MKALLVNLRRGIWHVSDGIIKCHKHFFTLDQVKEAIDNKIKLIYKKLKYHYIKDNRIGE